MSYGLLVAAALAALPTAPLPDRYMPVNDIKPGMTGVGKTVLKGTEIVEFKVTVLGVLRNVWAKQDMILIRCAGQNLEKTGIIAGMSGSPIYIDGKMIGALAYGWSFAKEPLAGVTPIAEMLRVGEHTVKPKPAEKADGDGKKKDGDRPERPASRVHRLWPPVKVDGRTYGRIRIATTPPTRPEADPAFPTLSPIPTPVMIAGAGKDTAKRLRPMLARAGCLPIQAGGAKPKVPADLEARLEPGAVCAVSLVTGDVDYTAVGTVTERVGNTIWAFGHPFYGDGETEMPLATGAVLAVMSGQSSSFKFGVALKQVGAIRRDESACIRGEIGAVPQTVACTARVHVKPEPPVTYRFNVLRQREYTPTLLRWVLYDAVFARSALPTECTVTFDASLNFPGRKPLKLGNIYAGSYGAMAMIGGVSNAAGELLFNDIEPVTLKSVETSITVEPGFRQAFIESMRMDTPKVKPGGEVKARVVLVPYRAEREIVPVSLTLPKEMPEGAYTLVVCDADSARSIDRAARPHRLEPRTLDDLFAVLRERHDNRRLYCRLQLKDQGVAVSGRELPRLPAFAMQVFGASRWSGAVTPLRRVVGASVPGSWILNGRLAETFQVTLKP